MYEIPEDRLPPGFVDTVLDPPARPAIPRPAATLVLLRNAGPGPEVLLMRRHRASGFVPGAWVFPGGRVDSADSGPALHERVHGLDSDPRPRSEYWVAALRELFEETGVLLARRDDGGWVGEAGDERRLEALRRSLMEDRAAIGDVLDELDAVLDVSGVVHIAHWVTPVVERRRYDTHFFAAGLPDRGVVRTDPREMVESCWLTPVEALARFERRELPMVFPTVKTLESLREYQSVEHVLDALRGEPVPRVLPRLVRTAGGVAIVVDDEQAGAGGEARRPAG